MTLEAGSAPAPVELMGTPFGRAAALSGEAVLARVGEVTAAIRDYCEIVGREGEEGGEEGRRRAEEEDAEGN